MSSSSPCCWVLVGSTGAGKSTLANELTPSNVDVEISDSAKSCTKGAQLYESLLDGISLIDTQGFEDTENESDLDVLSKTMKTIANNSLTKIKIIWIIRPENRKSPKLRRQCKFINALSKNVWKSVVLLCKKGKDKSAAKAALDLVSEMNYECKEGSIPVRNLHILDCIENYEKTYKRKIKKDQNERMGDDSFYIYKNEVSHALTQLLAQIEFCDPKIKKDYYHQKKRLIDHKKHRGYVKIDNYHKSDCYQTEDRKHIQRIKTRKYHLGGCKLVTKEYKHRGHKKKLKIHTQHLTTYYRHWGSTKNIPYHPGERRVKKESITIPFLLFVPLTIGEKVHTFYTCCNKDDNGCETKSKWSCCGYSKLHKGCESETKYKCCGGKEGSLGCTDDGEIYSECNCQVWRKGCTPAKKGYSCNKDDGCQIKQYYPCCYGNKNSIGCFLISKDWSCGHNNDGCVTEEYWTDCKCKRDRDGCTVDYKTWECCGEQENKNATIYKYESKGCQFKWIPANLKL